MTDDMIRALARKGGVVQINFGSDFLSQKSADASPFRTREGRARLAELARTYQDQPQRLREERERFFKEAYAKVPPATLDDLVAHIDHVVKLVGADYVGLGSDFDGVNSVPVGMEDVARLPNLTRALLERGYSAPDIRKVLGGNLLRVMREVERVAPQMGPDCRPMHRPALKPPAEPRRRQSAVGRIPDTAPGFVSLSGVRSFCCPRRAVRAPWLRQGARGLVLW